MPSEEEMASQLEIDEIIPQKTKWTDALHPKLDIKIKLKMNNGFQTFKQSKKIQPIKFIYKNFETDEPHVNNEHGTHKLELHEQAPMSQLMVKTLMKKDYFKENPHLIQFAKKPSNKNEEETEKELEK